MQKGLQEKIQQANMEALLRIVESEPYLVDIAPAIEVIPGMEEKMLLHAAPSVTWKEMCGPQKGAAIGAALFEGWAKSAEEVTKLFDNGEVKFEPAHSHSSLAGAGMMISPSMKVFIVENMKFGNKVYTHTKEETFHALRYGVYTDRVINNLKRARDILMPALKVGIREAGGINLKPIVAASLCMGDEGHNRNLAAGCLLEKQLMPYLVKSNLDRDSLYAIAELFDRDEQWLVYPEMAFCKCCLDAAAGIEYSTLVTVMARNGTYFGIRIGGLGDEWFTAPAPEVKGFFFPGYAQKDANRDMGDSAIMETGGLGAFAMAAAPALARFGSAVGLGGTVQDSIHITEEMYEITIGENPRLAIPNLDFRGTPTGIDMLKVIETGIQPIINTSLAHKDPGIGQIGAGWSKAPMECFKKALEAFSRKYKE